MLLLSIALTVGGPNNVRMGLADGEARVLVVADWACPPEALVPPVEVPASLLSGIRRRGRPLPSEPVCNMVGVAGQDHVKVAVGPGTYTAAAGSPVEGSADGRTYLAAQTSKPPGWWYSHVNVGCTTQRDGPGQ